MGCKPNSDSEGIDRDSFPLSSRVGKISEQMKGKGSTSRLPVILVLDLDIQVSPFLMFGAHFSGRYPFCLLSSFNFLVRLVCLLADVTMGEPANPKKPGCFSNALSYEHILSTSKKLFLW